VISKETQGPGEYPAEQLSFAWAAQLTSEVTHIEPRWPVVLAVIAVLSLLIALPDRVRAFPSWVPFLLAIVLIVPMLVLSRTRDKARWMRIERIVISLFLAIGALALAESLGYLVSTMVRHSAEVTGLQLLNSSVALWATNVLLFSLGYWRLDRGGPEARANGASAKPDWLFPQEGLPEYVPRDWHPTFIDYLFLAFDTATAFSPTDDLPLTSRAKLLMMLESIISLVTIIAVAARAINILGS
jgi:hypothetical protein